MRVIIAVVLTLAACAVMSQYRIAEDYSVVHKSYYNDTYNIGYAEAMRYANTHMAHNACWVE